MFALLSRFLKEETGQLNLYGKKFYNKNIDEGKTFWQTVLENVGTLQTEDAREMFYHYE